MANMQNYAGYPGFPSFPNYHGYNVQSMPNQQQQQQQTPSQQVSTAVQASGLNNSLLSQPRQPTLAAPQPVQPAMAQLANAAAMEIEREQQTERDATTSNAASTVSTAADANMAQQAAYLQQQMAAHAQAQAQAQAQPSNQPNNAGSAGSNPNPNPNAYPSNPSSTSSTPSYPNYAPPHPYYYPYPPAPGFMGFPPGAYGAPPPPMPPHLAAGAAAAAMQMQQQSQPGPVPPSSQANTAQQQALTSTQPVSTQEQPQTTVAQPSSTSHVGPPHSGTSTPAVLDGSSGNSSSSDLQALNASAAQIGSSRHGSSGSNLHGNVGQHGKARKPSHGHHGPFPSHHSHSSASHYWPGSQHRDGHHASAASFDDFQRHSHDPSHPSHHHSSRYHRHAFAPYPQSAASSRQPSPDMSPRSEFRDHSDDEGHHLNHGPGAGNAAVAAHAILGTNASGSNLFASEYTPSTSPVLGPLRGMSLRNPSRPTSPVHLPSLRYAPTGSASGTKSAQQSPTHSPDFASASDSHYQSMAVNLGQQLQHSLAGHHPAYGTGHYGSASHSHRSSHRSQPYSTSRQSSRHASPVDFGAGLGMSTSAGAGGHSGSGSGRSSGPPSATGTASHPTTPGAHDYAAGATFGNDKGLPPPSGMSLPPISGSAGPPGYFPSHHYGGPNSQPGSRTHTPPPLSPDREEAFAVPHQPSNAQRHTSGGHQFSMTPISLGQTYGSSVAKTTSPRSQHR